MNPNKLKLSFAEALRGKATASSSPTKELNTSEETQTSFIPITGDSETSPNVSTSSAILMDITSTTGSSTSSSFASRSAAERELLRESNFNAMADDVCKLCDGKLEKARLLSCLHIFCEDCLKKLLTADKVHMQPPMQIECPLCKQLTQLDKNGIDSLVCDFLHTNILDLANVETKDIACTSCKSKEPAISHCNDCDSLLCIGCDSAHKHMRCFENHRVLHFDQLKKRSMVPDDKVWTIHKPLFCNKHEQMHLKHYCFTCQSPICNSCLTNEKCGENHRYELITNAEKELTSEIANLTAVANKKIDECESASMQLKTARSKLHSQHNKAHEQIKEVTVRLKRLLDNVCVNTLFQLKKLHAERDLQIIQQLQHTTSVLERLHEACKFTAKVRQFANLNEFLNLKRSISAQMINLISNPIDCMVNFALGFSTEPNKYEENLREAIGTLHTELSPVPPCVPPTSTPQNDVLSSLVDQFQLSTIFSMTQQQLIDLNYNVQTANSGLYNTITFLDSTKRNDPEVLKAVSDCNNQTGHINHLTRPSSNPPSINATNSNIGALPLQVLSNFGSLGTRKGHFNSPHGFGLGQNDEIVVADTNNHRIVIYDKMGTLKFQFGIAGKEQGELWYPRKIAHMPVTGSYVICDRGNDRSRMQIFSNCGHFQRLIVIKYIDIVAGLTVTSRDEIVAVDSVSPTVFIISPLGKLLRWFDCSNYMCEPSDVAISGDMLYICDFKGHGVVVFRIDGLFLFRIGHENVTCFPNGIDVTSPGLIYVCDSHGNRFHVACYTINGVLKSEYECPHIKISRCCGLKLTSEGYFVTLAKNNHHVLVLNAPESVQSETHVNK